MKTKILTSLVLFAVLNFSVIKTKAQAGAALNFDGTNDYVRITNSTLGAFSIEFWMRTTQTGSGAPGASQWWVGKGIIDADAPSAVNDFGITLVGSKLAFGIGNPDVTIVSTSDVNTGNWVHVCAMFTSNPSGKMWLYINGVLEAYKASGVSGNARNTNTNINFGKIQSASSNYFNGDIDEVRLWNKTLSVCEIQSRMYCELVPPVSGLLYYYQFNQGTGEGSNTGITSITDVAGSNNGVPNNFAFTGTSSNFISVGGVTSGVSCTAPSANVVGNGNSITDGSSTTTTTNATSFGNVCINAVPVSTTYTIQNNGTNNLTIGTFTISGTDASSFSVTTLPTTTIAASSASAFAVTFTPSTTGTKNATITFPTNDCYHQTYSYAISATTVGAPTVTVSNGTICSGNSYVISPSGAITYTYSSGTATVSPSSTTSYTVVGSDANGCTNSNSAVCTVSVTTTPTVGLSGGTLCLGSSYTLTPSGASTYTFSGGSAVVSPTVTTTYSVTGSTGICVSQNTAVATITVNPIPTASVSATKTVMCAGDTSVLSITLQSGETVKWYKNGSYISGQTNTTYSATQAGNYTAIVTNISLCSTTSNIINIVVNALPVATVSASPANFCPGVTSITLTANTVTGASYSWLYNGTTIGGATGNTYTTASTGQYQIVITNTNNCTNTSAVTNLQTASVQNFTLSSPATSFCSGSNGSISTSLQSGATYAWIKNGSAYGSPAMGLNSISPATAGSYYVQVTNSYGCVSVSDTITMTVLALPTASISATNVNLCAGDSTLITAVSVAGATYEWFKNTVSTGVPQTMDTVIYGMAVANYKVVVNNGCSNTSNTIYLTQKNPPAAAGSISGNTSFCGGEVIDYDISSVSGATSYVWSISPSNAGSIASGQGTTSVTVNTTNQNFTLSVMPKNACGNGTASSLAVSLNTGFGVCSGAVYFAANNTNVCTGTTVIFTNYTDPNTYGGLTPQWNFGTGASPATATGNGPISVTYSTAGYKTVILQYVDPFNNVYGSDTKTSYINVSTPPVTSAISGNQTVSCNAAGELYQVINTAGSSYNWTIPSGAAIISGQGTNAITVNFGGTTGNISVVETNSGGCSGTAVSLSVTCATTGVADINSETVFSVYPNPAQNILTIQTNDKHKARISITDIAGKTVLTEEGNINNNYNLDISQYPAGMYFIKIVSEKNTQIIKVIKE